MKFYRFMKSWVGVLLKIVYRYEVTGLENLPESNRLVICSNHTHFLDPIAIAVAIPRDIHWMGKKELFENKLLNWFFLKLGAFPVNRDEVELSTIKTSLRVLKKEQILGIFPEGTRVDGFDLKNAKAGAALISIKGKSPILPIYIDSTYRLFSKIKVTIGPVISFEEAYNSKLSSEDYKLYSEKVLTTIYSLAGEEF